MQWQDSLQMHARVCMLHLQWFSQLLAEIFNLELRGRCYLNTYIFNDIVVLYIGVGGFGG